MKDFEEISKCLLSILRALKSWSRKETQLIIPTVKEPGLVAHALCPNSLSSPPPPPRVVLWSSIHN